MNNFLLTVAAIITFGLNVVYAQNPFSERSKKVEGKANINADLISNTNRTSAKNNSLTRKDGVLKEGHLVRYAKNHETPIWIKPSKYYQSNKENNGQNLGNYELNITYQYLTDVKNLIKINNPLEELQLQEKTSSENGMKHLKFHHYYRGIRIYASELWVHLNDNVVQGINGRYYPTPSIETNPTLTTENAKQKAIEFLNSINKPLTELNGLSQQIIEKHFHKNELIIYHKLEESKPYLAYELHIHPNTLDVYRVFVDAQSGEIIDFINELCTVDGPKKNAAQTLNNETIQLNTYEINNTLYLIDASRSMFSSSRSNLPSNPVGAIWTTDANNTDAKNITQVVSSNGIWSDKSSVSAHHYAGLSYQYFANTHGRNSIDGKGGTIWSIVNVSQSNGQSLENAYWNGSAMFYGNGGSAFKPLAGALDVAAHELTHGVIQNTANLEYRNQSGALNESFADIFGAMVDRDDWKMGEDIVKNGVFAGNALRDLSNPHNGGNSLNDNGYQPERMTEFYSGSADNGGVHINSGIVNRAFYIFATAITKEKAEKIYYDVLSNYLTSRSQFLDMRYAVEESAGKLYGNDEINAAKNAFDAVEIYDPNAGGGSGNPSGNGQKVDYPVNPGAEYVISLDLDNTNPNTWYRSSTDGDDFVALSQTKVGRKISVTDNGDFGLYINSNNQIVILDTDGNEGESLFDSRQIWGNVAVSKDGTKLAAVTIYQDSSIFVYDAGLEDWKQFRLFNPTYSEGVETGDVVYADALEWDHSGEHILYDAYNDISGVDYWDVGLIKVWDLFSNTWGDGQIEKLFTRLPTGVSIGNATFAKNSNYIIAYDYFDDFSDAYSLYATDYIEGNSKEVFTNVRLNFPSFSKRDDKLIFDAESSGEQVVGVLELENDKITPKSGGSLLINDAQWGVFFETGERSLMSSENDILSFGFPAFGEIAKGIIQGNTITVKVPETAIISSLVPTFVSSSFSTVLVGNNRQTSGASVQNFSNNVSYKVVSQDRNEKIYTVIVTKEEVGSLKTINSLNKIRIYPNPSTGLVNIEGMEVGGMIYAYNTQGQMIQNWTTTESQMKINLERGLYVIKVVGKKGTVNQFLLID